MENELDNLILELTQKKELKGLKKEIVLETIKEYEEFNKNKFLSLKNKNFNKKSKEFLELKKFVRKKLRNIHGVFQKNKLSDRKKKDYLENKDFDFFSQKNRLFLKSHRSTNERFNYYETVYGEIQNITGKITSLTDLGCGLNPLSYSLLESLKKVYCVDINEEEIHFLNEFIKNNNQLEGGANVLDLTKKESLKEIKVLTKETDCCFLFKLLDGLESKKKGSSKDLLNNIESKSLVISFSKKTISGKNNITSERKWFQDLIKEQLKNKKLNSHIIGDEEYFVLTNT